MIPTDSFGTGSLGIIPEARLYSMYPLRINEWIEITSMKIYHGR